MRVYEIALPLADNKGKALGGAHAAFQITLQSEFGGYTKGAPAEGSWLDEKTGQVHAETMVPYRVAVGENHPVFVPGVMSWLSGKAGGLFPDQKAFFVAEIGTAQIISNGWMKRHDRATAGAGKTDSAFEAAAEAPIKSSTQEPVLKPFEYHVAKRVLEAAEDDRVRQSKLTWGLSEALRDYDQGADFSPVMDALLKLSVAIR